MRTLTQLAPLATLTGLTALNLHSNTVQHLTLLPSFVLHYLPTLRHLDGSEVAQGLFPEQRNVMAAVRDAVALHAQVPLARAMASGAQYERGVLLAEERGERRGGGLAARASQSGSLVRTLLARAEAGEARLQVMERVWPQVLLQLT
jgi:hypothetical protein